MEDLQISDIYKVLETPELFGSPESLGQFLGNDYTIDDVYSLVNKDLFPSLNKFQTFFGLEVTNPLGETIIVDEQERGESGYLDWFKNAAKKLLGKDVEDTDKIEQDNLKRNVRQELETEGILPRGIERPYNVETPEEMRKHKKKTKAEVEEELRMSYGIKYPMEDYILNYPAKNNKPLNPDGTPKFKTMQEYEDFINEEINVATERVVMLAGDKGEEIFAIDATSTPDLQNGINEIKELNNITIETEEGEVPLPYEDKVRYIRDRISKYGFLVEQPISYDRYEKPTDIPSLDNFKKDLEGKIETEATINPDDFIVITSLDENEAFNFNLKGGPEEVNKLAGFINEHARYPEKPNPEESNIAKALDAKEARSGAKYNLDTNNFSSHKMISVEIDGQYFAMPSLFPVDPDVQSTYADRWIEYNPETQLEEIIDMAESRGEKYAFNTEAEAERFAEGSWKDYNTVDLEKERFFVSKGVEDYRGIIEATDDYNLVRDELELLNEIQGTTSNVTARNLVKDLYGEELSSEEITKIMREQMVPTGKKIVKGLTAVDPDTEFAYGYWDGHQLIIGEPPAGMIDRVKVYAGKELIVPPEVVKRFPELFLENGKMRPDWIKRKAELEKKRDNLYNITQDENYQEISLQWDLEAAKRREKYTKEAVIENQRASSILGQLGEYSQLVYGVSLNELENYQLNNVDQLTPEQNETIDYIIAAKAQAEDNKIYAADQYIVSQTYLDSKAIKNAQDVVLEGFWPQVKNEWITRRHRGKAAEKILVMSLMSDNPLTIQEIDGMSREEVATYVSKHMQKSVSKSKGMSKEMLEWNRAKGWTEKMDVFMDNPFDMGVSLAAGSFSEMLPYGIKIIPGAGLIGVGLGVMEGLAKRKWNTGKFSKGRGQTTLQKVIGRGAKLNPRAFLKENIDLVLEGLEGGVTGVFTGAAATILSMEYTTAFFESATENGYDIFDPEDMLLAMNDPNVWNETRDVGLARGIPIAVVDYLIARTAGKIFLGRRGLFKRGLGRADAWKAAGLVVAERAIVDPSGEAYGEYLAQSANELLNSKVFKADEIALEAIGAFGSNTSNAVMNLTLTALKNEHIVAGKKMGDTEYYSSSTYNNENVTNWAANMNKLGLLDSPSTQKIQKNIGYKRDAQLLLGLGEKGIASSDLLPVQTKMMELIAAKDKLSENEMIKSLFGKSISLINNELKNLATKKGIVASEDTEEVNKIVNQVLGKETQDEAIDEDAGNVKQELQNEIESMDEERDGDIAEVQEEISSVKIDLKNDLKQPGLTKIEKIELREDAKATLDDLKFEISEIKAEARKAISQAKKAVKARAPKPKKAEDTDVSLSQSPIADLFTNDQTSNTNVVAFSKVPLETLKDKRIPGGTTRDVYDIGNDRVIKIAKNPKGLQQNQSIGYGDLRMLGDLVPDIYEVGTDYIVVEKVPRNDKAVKEFLKPLQKFSAIDFEIRNRPVELTETMEKLGLQDFLNYNILWNDFKAPRNWGQRADGTFVLVDEGALNENATSTSEVPAWAKQEWADVKRIRKGGTDVSLSQRRIPLKNLLIDYGYDTKNGFFPKTIADTGSLKKALQTYGYDLITNTDERTGEVTGHHIAQEGGKRKLDLFKNEKLEREARQEEEASPKTREELIEVLNKAFPGVKVYDSIEEFEKSLNDPGVIKRETKDGYIAYGAKGDGSIYLNPDDKTLRLPIHEFGHIWLDYLKSKDSGAKGTALHKRGLQLITSTEEGQKLYDEQVEIYGEGPKAREEALVEYIAIEGEKKTKQAERQTKDKLYKWYEALMKFIKDTYLKVKDLFKSKTFATDVKGMSLEDFVKMALGDLLGGETIVSEVKVDKKGQTKLDLSQEKITQVPRGSDMVEVVTEARELGIKDEEIKSVLAERIKRGENINARNEVRFSMDDVNQAMTVMGTELISLPPAFRNIKGGVYQGMALYTEVQNKINKAIGRGTTTDIRNTHIALIKKRFPTATKGKSAAQILKLYPISSTVMEKAKTPGEIRALAMAELKANPIFAAQSPAVKEKLIADLDKDVNIKANRDVQTEINQIRNNLRLRKEGEKNISKVKKDLTKLISLLFPKTELLNRSDLTYMNNRIAAVNEKNQLAEIENVISRINKVEDRIKKDLLNKISKLIEAQAKTNITQSRKTRKSAQIDVTTKEFFIAARDLINKFNSPQALELFAKEMNDLAGLEYAISKLREQENLSREDRELIARADAFGLLGNLPEMNLTQVEQLFDDLKNLRTIGRSIYQGEQEERRVEMTKLEKEADTQIKKTNPDLFFEDGTPKNLDTLNTEGRDALQGYKKSGFLGRLVKYKNSLLDMNFKRVMQQMQLDAFDSFAMGNLFYSTLDNRNGTFLTDQFYYRLAAAEENANSIFFDFYDRLAEIADGVLGKKVYNNALAERLGLGKFGKVNAYQYINYLADNGKSITIKGINVQKQATAPGTIFSTPEAMRIYSLWKNPDSKIILTNDGFTQEKINQIEKFIGKDLATYADRVVDFLTNEVYPLVNAKHREIYGVNLPFRELYFPRATQPIIGEVSSYGFDVDSQSNLNAIKSMLPGSLSETTSPNNLRMILTDMNFFNVLDNYIQDVARWTGYATDIKVIENIIKMPSVDALLSTSGMKQMVIYNINVAIDPQGKTRGANKTQWVSKQINVITSYFLALHPMQFLKQASSVVMAYPLYNNPKFQVFKKTMKAGDPLFTKTGLKGVTTDVVKLLYNTAATVLNEPPNIAAFMTQVVKGFSPIEYARRKAIALKISATFRKRNWEAKDNNIYMLYTGREKADTFDSSSAGIRRRKESQSFDIVKKAFGFFTAEGDLAGVMGYVIVYENMIAQGFTHDQALKVFNDYNLTNQSRRGIDKPGIQTQKSGLSQVFTSFTTTPLQILSNSYLSIMNVLKDAIRDRVVPDMKDINTFAWVGFIGVMMFQAVGSMWLLLLGDKDDREKFWKQINVYTGIQTWIDAIPLMNEAVSALENEINGTPYRKGKDSTTIPIVEYAEELGKWIRNEEDRGWALQLAKGLYEFVQFKLGVQFDIFEYPLEQAVEGNNHFMYDFLKMMRVPNSRIPQRWLPKRKSKKRKKKFKSKRTR